MFSKITFPIYSTLNRNRSKSKATETMALGYSLKRLKCLAAHPPGPKNSLLELDGQC